MMKEIFLLQGLTKLDQLVSSVTYSPLRARNRRGEESKGCPPDCTTGREEPVSTCAAGGDRRGALASPTAWRLRSC